MKPLFAIAFVIVLAAQISAQADVLIYNFTEKGVVTGDRKSVPLLVRAFFVSDVDANNAVAVGYFTLNRTKYYAAIPSEDGFTLRVNSTNNVSYTVMTKAFTVSTNSNQLLEMKQEFYKGRNTNLKIKSSRYFTAPAALSGTSRSAEANGDGTSVITESSITATFNSTATLSANANNDTVATVVNRYKALLEANGYVPIPQ